MTARKASSRAAERIGLLSLTIIGWLLIHTGSALAQDAAVENDRERPNPHWRQDSCQACHQAGVDPDQASLLSKDVDALCNTCHGSDAGHGIIHPTGLRPTKKMKNNMSQPLQASLDPQGRTTCISCHDVKIQCDKRLALYRQSNPYFLRSGPYRSRTAFCYQCHDAKAYQRLNSHDQVDDKGQIKTDRCLICHSRVPEQKPDAKPQLHLKQDLKQICLNCHKWRPHPGGDLTFFSKGAPDHLVVPPAQILKDMQRTTAEARITLPLEPGTGKVYCATCHNPHARGVIKDSQLAKGAGENKRLRVQKICTLCHAK